jgi:creatinine amidohydrolase
MGTDSALATSVATKAATLSRDIVVAPTIPYGMSRHHDRLPGGSVSLPPRLLVEVLVAVVTDLLSKRNSRSVVLLNGHGGNWPSITCALDELGGLRGELPVAACSWWDLVRDLVEPRVSPGERPVGHAGLVETSAMLAVAPDQVALARADGIAPRTAPALEPSFPNSTYRWRDFARIHPSGVTGPPFGATAEFGRELIEAAARRLVELATALRETPPADADR